ncbi:hypothetical protein [Campylobacter lanienae]|uniref:hypothetical protein n=1 Tax=Campylobacter lanienae TaxID=75658 RepID=UPI00242DF1AD|nr:hypothetical protein [Campylobacter lanienae]MCI5539610.1 hypothetical protein [Campylobacter lanienae]MDD7514321.1 hypothetical protein [Campylobacter lanienae]MDY5518675.1 hypothetical protein [Campylobacter lanienae]
MKETTRDTLITGLWENESSDGKSILIGRIGANLNAVVVENPNYEDGSTQPKFLLYFFNGKQEKIKSYKFTK